MQRDDEAFVMRLIQLKNSLYLDDRQGEAAEPKEELWKYCTFGYFDAMYTVAKKFSMKKDEGPYAWKLLSDGVMEAMDGSCSIRSFLCISGDADKDEEFWKEEDKTPLLFMSFIRLKGDALEQTVQKANELNAGKTGVTKGMRKAACIMAYLSYEHSEMVVFLKTDRYSDGRRLCENLHKELGIHKMYTIAAVKEKDLASYEHISRIIVKEYVSCRFRAIIKDWSKVDSMRQKLEEELREENGEELKIRHYRMMGETDMLLEVDKVPIDRLFALYKTGNMLTHSSRLYQECWRNLETEIFVGGHE